MIKNLSHLTLLVKNQDDALHFWTRKVGFELHTDAPFGATRWLTVCPQATREFELVLMLPEKTDDALIVGRQAGSAPLAVFMTDECHKDYNRMKANGVIFVSAPEEHPWGIQALFKDDYGNIFNLVEPRN